MEEGQKDFKMLQHLIDEAIRDNKPYDCYVKEQIHLLEDSLNQFLENAKEEGYDIIHNPKVGEIEVRQYTAMKQLSMKIGLPIEQYDEKIKQIRIRIFGEENYKRFFEQ